MSLTQIKSNIEKTEQRTVSVIIATYKRDITLKNAIQSVIMQTYNSIEIIVVDDNALIEWNKKVKDVVDEMSLLHPIIYIQNEMNKGSAETRNVGIKVASGEYITFLDDDDIYLQNKVKNQLEYMIEKKSDFCVTDVALYDENDKLIEKRNRNYIKRNSKEDLIRYHLLYHITGNDTMMFKKHYLLGIGGFSPINVGDDFYLIERAIENEGIFSYLPVCDIKAYVHTNTEGLSSGESKIKGENELYEYKKKFFSQLNKKDIRYIKMRHYAVLAFAEIRRKRWICFFKNATLSCISSPLDCAKLFIETH